MSQSDTHACDVTSAPQEPSALAPVRGELTAAELAHIVGGTDGPGGPGDGTGVQRKATPILM